MFVYFLTTGTFLDIIWKRFLLIFDKIFFSYFKSIVSISLWFYLSQFIISCQYIGNMVAYYQKLNVWNESPTISWKKVPRGWD